MYYNTNDETGGTLQRSRTRTATQEDIIFRIFDGESDLELSPSELLIMLGPNTVWPITSVRRALSDLTSAGKLTKTENKRLGPYGKHEFTWKLA